MLQCLTNVFLCKVNFPLATVSLSVSSRLPPLAPLYYLHGFSSFVEDWTRFSSLFVFFTTFFLWPLLFCFSKELLLPHVSFTFWFSAFFHTMAPFLLPSSYPCSVPPLPFPSSFPSNLFHLPSIPLQSPLDINHQQTGTASLQATRDCLAFHPRLRVAALGHTTAQPLLPSRTIPLALSGRGTCLNRRVRAKASLAIRVSL